jgi:hypothetical protein
LEFLTLIVPHCDVVPSPSVDWSWNLGTRGAGVLLDRRLEVFKDLIQGKVDPGVREIVEFGYLFFWIYEQIVDRRVG